MIQVGSGAFFSGLLIVVTPLMSRMNCSLGVAGAGRVCLPSAGAPGSISAPPRGLVSNPIKALLLGFGPVDIGLDPWPRLQSVLDVPPNVQNFRDGVGAARGGDDG
jgi:hypothetical protein